jgi:hypothetical protein
LPPGWEAYAAARARGLTQLAAYAAAGYSATNKQGAKRMDERDCVRARVKVFAAIEARLPEAGAGQTVIALTRAAAVGQSQGGNACLREVRLTLLAAQRLHALIGPSTVAQAPQPPPGLTDEAWMAQFGKG